MGHSQQQPPEQQPDAMLLRPDVLRPILAQCSAPRDLLSAAQVCQAWRAIAAEDWLWAQLARREYPPSVIKPEAYAGSHKALVLDGNGQNATLALPLDPLLSAQWKRNGPRVRYCCRVLGCSLPRSFPSTPSTTLRLAFDARGQADLRHPSTSCLAVMLVIRPAQQQHQHQQQQELGAAPPALPPPPAFQAGEFAMVWASSRPTHELLVEQQPGHYQGVLEWDHGTACRVLNRARPWEGLGSRAAALARLRRTLQSYHAMPGQQALKAQGIAALELDAPCGCARRHPPPPATLGQQGAAAAAGPSSEAAAGQGTSAPPSLSGASGEAGGQVELLWRVAFFYACDPHDGLMDYEPVTLLEQPWCPQCMAAAEEEQGTGGPVSSAAAPKSADRAADRWEGRGAAGPVVRCWRRQGRYIPADEWERSLTAQPTAADLLADRQLWEQRLLPREFVQARMVGWWVPPSRTGAPVEWRRLPPPVPMDWGFWGHEWAVDQAFNGGLAALHEAMALLHGVFPEGAAEGGHDADNDALEQQADVWFAEAAAGHGGMEEDQGDEEEEEDH